MHPVFSVLDGLNVSQPHGYSMVMLIKKSMRMSLFIQVAVSSTYVCPRSVRERFTRVGTYPGNNTVRIGKMKMKIYNIF